LSILLLALHTKHHKAREKERGKEISKKRKRLRIVTVRKRLDSRRRRKKRLSKEVRGLVKRPRKQKTQKQHYKYIVASN
jgi:hypothetical protein